MNPKHRKVLLEELAALEKFIADYPAVKNIFPDIVARIQALHKDVLYDKVEDKTGGLDLQAGRIREIRDFAIAANKLRDGFIAALDIKTGGDIWITTESLTKAALGAKLESNLDLFDPLIAAVKEKLDSVSGEGITKSELCSELKDVLSSQYGLLDEKAISKCTSLRAIKNLNIPILDGFIDDLKKYKGLDYDQAAPDYATFCTALNQAFDTNAVVTQEIFEKEVNTWLTTVAAALKVLATDKLAGAAIHVQLLSGLLKQQFAALPEVALKQVHAELDALILAIKEDPALTLKDCVAQLEASLKGFKMPKPSTADRAAATSAANIRTQLAKINITTAVLGAVNINSPIFIVNQPNFKQNLVQKLSDWKDGLVNSLAVGADLILKLDGCTVNGASFKSGILDCAKIDAVHKVLSGLAFNELKLKGHKDLKIFDEKWGNPWKAALKTIDVEKQIVAVYEGDATMLVGLYTDLYTYLPSEDHVIATLNLSVGGKINLALEAVKKLEKRVDKIDEEVKLIKEVNDVQTLGLGYNSIITEVDLVFKNIIDAHKDYVTRVNLFCVEYNAAYEQVNKNIKSFNKASEAIKAFWETIGGIIKTIGTAALCATGVGIAAKMAEGLARRMTEKMIEAGITMLVDAGAPKLGNLIVGDFATIENDATTPFSKYLTEQIKGEITVRDTLKAILKISENFQTANRYIQLILDSKKTNINMQPLIEEYNTNRVELEKFLADQKQCINKYRAETSKLTSQSNITRKKIERNMYIGIITAQLKKEVTHNNWQIICDATDFRNRLEVDCNLISKTDFVDNAGYDSGTDDELKRLYAQEEIDVF